MPPTAFAYRATLEAELVAVEQILVSARPALIARADAAKEPVLPSTTSGMLGGLLKATLTASFGNREDKLVRLLAAVRREIAVLRRLPDSASQAAAEDALFSPILETGFASVAAARVLDQEIPDALPLVKMITATHQHIIGTPPSATPDAPRVSQRRRAR